MSVVINYVSKQIAVIASDTRISIGKNGEHGFSDNNTKLVETPFGWCSGVGEDKFLKLFKLKLAEVKINDTKEIESIFKDAVDKAIENSLLLDIDDIHSSAVSFSWRTQIGEDFTYRIGCMCKKSYEDDIRLVKDDTFKLFYPSEYIENTKLLEQFEENFNLEYKYNPDNENSLYELLNIIYSMFKCISNDAKSVSKNCHIGLLMYNGKNMYKYKYIFNVDNQVD